MQSEGEITLVEVIEIQLERLIWCSNTSYSSLKIQSLPDLKHVDKLCLLLLSYSIPDTMIKPRVFEKKTW